MKFFHLSDLHFGKQLNGYDLEAEQRKCMQEVVEAAKREKPDAIIIAGDVYDRSVPSGSAMSVLEDFFVAINEISRETDVSESTAKEEQKSQNPQSSQNPIEILVIAGNHDSAQRLQYGSTFLERHHIHIAVKPPQSEKEHIRCVTLQDAFGAVHFYLLPYTRYGMIRHFAPEGMEDSMQETIRYLLEREDFDRSERNVLVSHQFYVNGSSQPKQCDSEAPRLAVGGLDAVDTALIKDFDYAALGHIHSPQSLSKDTIRYCGTLYPYSVSEAGQEKSITVVELQEKGTVTLRYLPIRTEHTILCLRGTLEELTQGRTKVCEDYVSITLTDEGAVESPKEYLEHYFSHILEIQIDNRRTRQILEEQTEDVREMTPLEAFSSFFLDVTGRSMDEQETRVLQEILQEVYED